MPSRFLYVLPLLVLSVLATLAGCASRAPVAAIPDKLVPAGERPIEVLSAVGVQVYECRAVAGPSGPFAWAFVAPEADLFDRAGRKVGRHYAGPHWEAADGSKVAAKVRERMDAPSGDAIPWLLLQATPAGGGRFGTVTSIQRVNTVGGNAPASGCTAATAGQPARVFYAADYALWGR